MARREFVNFSRSRVVAVGANTITIEAGDPLTQTQIRAGRVLPLTLFDEMNEEIVLATERNGNVLTVQRARENTNLIAWNPTPETPVYAVNVPTAGSLGMLSGEADDSIVPREAGISIGEPDKVWDSVYARVLRWRDRTLSLVGEAAATWTLPAESGVLALLSQVAEFFGRFGGVISSQPFALTDNESPRETPANYPLMGGKAGDLVHIVQWEAGGRAVVFAFIHAPNAPELDRSLPIKRLLGLAVWPPPESLLAVVVGKLALRDVESVDLGDARFVSFATPVDTTIDEMIERAQEIEIGEVLRNLHGGFAGRGFAGEEVAARKQVATNKVVIGGFPVVASALDEDETAAGELVLPKPVDGGSETLLTRPRISEIEGSVAFRESETSVASLGGGKTGSVVFAVAPSVGRIALIGDNKSALSTALNAAGAGAIVDGATIAGPLALTYGALDEDRENDGFTSVSMIKISALSTLAVAEFDSAIALADWRAYLASKSGAFKPGGTVFAGGVGAANLIVSGKAKVAGDLEIGARRIDRVYSVARAPTDTDDETAGVRVGDIWRNEDILYICTDAAEGAAVWQESNKKGAELLWETSDGGTTLKEGKRFSDYSLISVCWNSGATYAATTQTLPFAAWLAGCEVGVSDTLNEAGPYFEIAYNSDTSFRSTRDITGAARVLRIYGTF